MLAPRWNKVFRDLLGNKARTLLVVIAIAVGVFAFGSVFITQEILLKNIKFQYQKYHPSNITIYLTQFDSTLIRWVKRRPGVAEVSAKVTGNVKLIQKYNNEVVLNLTSVPDFSNMMLNLLAPKKGIWPPQKGEIFLERGSLSPSQASVGDSIRVKTQDGRNYTLYLSGIVYDNSAIPFVFMNQMTGYVSLDTMAYLGFQKDFNQLEIANDASLKSLSDAEKFTFDLTESLKERDVVVLGTRVNQPGKHWAEDNSKAFTTILSVIGIFSLILSGFLVINTISALLTQQKKQIGIMKAIGAKRGQITSLYLAMVAAYGLLALLIALPVGMLLSFVFLKMITNFLNMDVDIFYFPFSIFIMELITALIVPILAALIPILSGTKTSIRSVISDYQPVRVSGSVERYLAKIRGLSRPVLISLRNVFRKKGRLILTLGTLVTAGALFMSVLNIQKGMYLELSRILQMFDFAVSINLNGDYQVTGMENRLKEIPEVTKVEARTGVEARRIKKDGTKGGEFGISGLPPDTVFSHPVILSGRWLKIGDSNQIVLSSSYIRDNSDLTVGDQLSVEIGNKKYNFEIVGIIAMSSDQKIGFMEFNNVARLKDKPQLASSFLIKTEPDDAATQKLVESQSEDRLKRSGISVSGKETRSEIFSSAANQFSFLIFFLLAMAVMVAFVGGLGLAGTMSLNVLERTREIGIMRSLGAGNSEIRRLVLIEGILVGLISWIIAIPLTLPITYGFCIAIGKAFFGRTLVFAIVPQGMAIWLIIVLVIAIIASVLPAQRASKMSISETLSYE